MKGRPPGGRPPFCSADPGDDYCDYPKCPCTPIVDATKALPPEYGTKVLKEMPQRSDHQHCPHLEAVLLAVELLRPVMVSRCCRCGETREVQMGCVLASFGHGKMLPNRQFVNDTPGGVQP